MGSNDGTITDNGTSHFVTGTLANIRDGDLTTRVDNYQVNQPANVNGFVGISWAAARPEAIKSLTLSMAHFVDGGWFGNRESPRSGFPLTPEMLVPPVVQVSANLTTWTTVPSTSNYLSAFSVDSPSRRMARRRPAPSPSACLKNKAACAASALSGRPGAGAMAMASSGSSNWRWKRTP